MTQTESTPTPARTGVPIWAQILIWLTLLGVLVVLLISLFHAQVPMIRNGESVPDFNMTFYEGYEYNDLDQLQLSALNGKVVVINFWASWCVPCAEEAALLESAWQYYRPGDEVVFLGIDYVDTPAAGLDYLARYGVTYPNGPDLQESISPYFNRNMGVPETYFIDQQGILRYIQIGPFASLEQIQAIIAPLLAE